MFRSAVVGVVVSLAVGCGPPPAKDTLPATETLSAAEHMTEAQRHDREAAAHQSLAADKTTDREATGAPVSCADTSYVGVPTSGGERLRLVHPCWTSVTRPDARHVARAAQHQKWSGEHRAVAAKLLGAETRACKGLPTEAVDHSPFFHGQDISTVEAIAADGEPRGVRVQFEKVPGLNLEFMERSVQCHQARAAAMGYSTTFMPHCPLALQHISVTSEVGDSGQIVVTFRSDRSEVAAAVHGRIEDLVKEGSP